MSGFSDSESESGTSGMLPPFSSPPREVIRSLEEDLCALPTSIQACCVGASVPGASPDSVFDVPEPSGSSVDATQMVLSARSADPQEQSDVWFQSTIRTMSAALWLSGSDSFGLGERCSKCEFCPKSTHITWVGSGNSAFDPQPEVLLESATDSIGGLRVWNDQNLWRKSLLRDHSTVVPAFRHR